MLNVGLKTNQPTTPLHSHWQFDRLKAQNTIDLTDIQKAARFYAINRMAFGGRMTNPSFGYARTTAPGLTVERFKRDIDLLSARLDRVYIECLSYADCITRYDSVDTLVYCDPPYYQTAGYGVEFAIGQYVKMAEIAQEIKGKILISVNDCGAMREIFSGFIIEQLAIKYSCGKVEKGQSRKESFELLISNF